MQTTRNALRKNKLNTENSSAVSPPTPAGQPRPLRSQNHHHHHRPHANRSKSPLTQPRITKQSITITFLPWGKKASWCVIERFCILCVTSYYKHFNLVASSLQHENEQTWMMKASKPGNKHDFQRCKNSVYLFKVLTVLLILLRLRYYKFPGRATGMRSWQVTTRGVRAVYVFSRL